MCCEWSPRQSHTASRLRCLQATGYKLEDSLLEAAPTNSRRNLFLYNTARLSLFLLFLFLYLPFQLLLAFDKCYHPTSFRLLTKQERRALSPTWRSKCGMSKKHMEKLQIAGDGSWLGWLLLSSGDAALTVNHTFFTPPPSISTPGQVLPPPRLEASTVRHEAVHSVQYARLGGFAPFLSSYFAHMLIGAIATWKLGSSSADEGVKSKLRDTYQKAYCVNPLEVEAYCKENLNYRKTSTK